MVRIIAAVVLMVLFNAQSWAGFVSGSDLLEQCKLSEGPFLQGECYGYIAGVADIVGNFKEAGWREKDYCWPSGESGVTLGQVKLEVVKYLEKHPDDLHRSASGLVYLAFVEAYPCK